jgi:GGDEF domain-containing protein
MSEVHNRPPATGSVHDARLRYVLSAVPDLYRPQPVDSLMDRLLRLASTLSGAETGFVAMLADHDLVTRRTAVEGIADLQDPVVPQETPLVVRAVRGMPLRSGVNLVTVPGQYREPGLHAVHRNESQTAGSVIAVPIRLGVRAVGTLVMEVRSPADLSVLEEAAYHVSQALQNLVLFAAGSGMMPAGYDHAVRLRLEQALRADYRRLDPCSVVCVGVVGLDQIRRRAGRLAADGVVFHLSQYLRRIARDTDTVGRTGVGDFLVILPSTGVEGATIFARRLGADRHRLVVEGSETAYEADLGIAGLPSYDGSLGPVARELFEALTSALMQAAREAMEAGRSAGVSIPVAECSWNTLLAEARRPGG